MKTTMNKLILTLCKILSDCIGKDIDVEKIALLASTLLNMHVDIESPIIDKACKEIVKKMQKDYGWTCPYDTALSLGTLKFNPYYFDIVGNGEKILVTWNKSGMWGRNDRDVQRLVATSRVFLFIGNELMRDNLVDEKLTEHEVVRIWKRDINEVGYVFKASAYLYIISKFKDITDRKLVIQTIDLIQNSLVKGKKLKYAYLSEVGRSDLETVAVTLISLIQWKEYVNNELLQEIVILIKNELNKENTYADYIGLSYAGLALSEYEKKINKIRGLGYGKKN